MWENFTKNWGELQVIKRKNYKNSSLRVSGEAHLWKSGQHTTTLFCWWCEWSSDRVFCLRVFFSSGSKNHPLRKEDHESISTLKGTQISLKKAQKIKSDLLWNLSKKISKKFLRLKFSLWKLANLPISPEPFLAMGYLYAWWGVTAFLKVSTIIQSNFAHEHRIALLRSLK